MISMAIKPEAKLQEYRLADMRGGGRIVEIDRPVGMPESRKDEVPTGGSPEFWRRSAGQGTQMGSSEESA
jgi:hypothetical protein